MLKPNKIIRNILNLLIIAIILGLPLYIGYNNSKNFDTILLKDSIIVNGTIFSYEYITKHSPSFKYTFDLDGFSYQSESSNSGIGSDYPSLSSQLIGKSFPVIVNKDVPKKYNKILITPADFKNFNLPYPDSLLWVKTILDNVR